MVLRDTGEDRCTLGRDDKLLVMPERDSEER